MPAFPFRDAVAVLAAAMCLAVLAASPARAQESGPSLPDSVTVQNVALPDNVGTDGAFTTFVPFDIPGFAGSSLLWAALQLAMAGHGAGQLCGAWLAAGGSVGDREAQRRRRTPHHERGRDVFLLDGVELLACADEAATNTERWEKWYPYPERYKTTIPNASCSAGGSMTTLRDDYRRIDFVGDASRGVAEFHVYDRDGTRYTYETVGRWPGSTPPIPRSRTILAGSGWSFRPAGC
ncbi:MAG: hypothetical protein JKP98_14460 [Rhodobacteraceae bacterium]|nr:hypothetical protein [Paracoccaceae bacterium]